MEQYIKAAKLGREKWLSLVQHHHIDNSMYVILLPSNNRDYNYPAMYYLDCFLKKRGVKSALVLSHDEWVMKDGAQLSEKAVLEVCSKEDANNLMQFYCMYEFAPNFIIGSLEEPAGRLGKYIIGKKGLNSDEVFAAVVYSLVEL